MYYLRTQPATEAIKFTLGAASRSKPSATDSGGGGAGGDGGGDAEEGEEGAAAAGGAEEPACEMCSS